MLPVKPRLARSFEDLPGEACNPLIHRFISMRRILSSEKISLQKCELQ